MDFVKKTRGPRIYVFEALRAGSSCGMWFVGEKWLGKGKRKRPRRYGTLHFKGIGYTSI